MQKGPGVGKPSRLRRLYTNLVLKVNVPAALLNLFFVRIECWTAVGIGVGSSGFLASQPANITGECANHDQHAIFCTADVSVCGHLIKESSARWKLTLCDSLGVTMGVLPDVKELSESEAEDKPKSKAAVPEPKATKGDKTTSKVPVIMKKPGANKMPKAKAKVKAKASASKKPAKKPPVPEPAEIAEVMPEPAESAEDMPEPAESAEDHKACLAFFPFDSHDL